VIPFVKLPGKTFDSQFSVADEARITSLICRVLTHKNARLVGQNFQYDQYFMWRSWGIVTDCYADTMLAQHVFLPGEPKDLGYLSSLYCRYHRYWKDDNKEWALKGDLHQHFLYNGEDNIRTLEIISRQLPMLEKLGAMKPNLPGGRSKFSFMMNQNRVCFSMSRRGALTDAKRRIKLQIEMSEAASLREAKLLSIVPQELFSEPKTKKKEPTLWYNSNKLQQELYYDILGLPVQRHRKTKQPTLDKETLPKFIDRFPWIEPFTRPLLELRQIDVFSSNFLAAKVVNNRMHCTFNPGGTETFRLSSGKTPLDEGCNAQNQPKGNEKDV
jgi:DNA polymerase I-like protein with 3'-5' exonuclease and polymerase domains